VQHETIQRASRANYTLKVWIDFGGTWPMCHCIVHTSGIIIIIIIISKYIYTAQVRKKAAMH